MEVTSIVLWSDNIIYLYKSVQKYRCDVIAGDADVAIFACQLLTEIDCSGFQ